jgi:hypothetical protein
VVVRPVVVDIETIGVEVADDDTVAVRVPIFYSPSSLALEIEVYFPLKRDYILSFLYFIWEQPSINY